MSVFWSSEFLDSAIVNISSVAPQVDPLLNSNSRLLNSRIILSWWGLLLAMQNNFICSCALHSSDSCNLHFSPCQSPILQLFITTSRVTLLLRLWQVKFRLPVLWLFLVLMYLRAAPFSAMCSFSRWHLTIAVWVLWSDKMVLLSSADPAGISTKTMARFDACEFWAFHEGRTTNLLGTQGMSLLSLSPFQEAACLSCAGSNCPRCLTCLSLLFNAVLKFCLSLSL